MVSVRSHQNGQCALCVALPGRASLKASGGRTHLDIDGEDERQQRPHHGLGELQRDHIALRECDHPLQRLCGARAGGRGVRGEEGSGSGESQW
jgi:hypothetical protein